MPEILIESKQHALHFAGQHSLSYAPFDQQRLQHGLTLGVWVRPTASQAAAAVVRFPALGLGIAAGSLVLLFHDQTMVSGAQLRADRWHHLGLVVDPQQTQLVVYANGRQVLKHPYTSTLPDLLQGPLVLGSDAFVGDIGPLTLSSSVKSPRQVALERFTQPAQTDPDLLACWWYEDGFADLSGRLLPQNPPTGPAGPAWIPTPAMPRSPMQSSLGHQLLSDTKQHNNRKIQQAKADAHDHIQAAHAQAQDHVQTAHQRAIAQARTASIDRVGYLQGEQLRWLNATGQPDQSMATIRTGQSLFTCMACYEYNQKPRAIIGTRWNGLQIWDLSTNTCLAILPNKSEINTISVYQEQQQWRAITGDRNGVQIWDLSEEPIPATIETAKVTLYSDLYGGASVNLGIGEYSDLAAAGFSLNALTSLRIPYGLQVTIYDQKNCLGQRRILHHDVANLGDSLWCFNDRAQSIQITKRPQWSCLYGLAHGAEVTQIAIYQDAGRWRAVSAGVYVRVWELGSGLLLANLKGHQMNTNTVAVYEHNGWWALTGSMDSTMRLWSLKFSDPTSVTAYTEPQRRGQAYRLQLFDAYESLDSGYANPMMGVPRSFEVNKPMAVHFGASGYVEQTITSSLNDVNDLKVNPYAGAVSRVAVAYDPQCLALFQGHTDAITQIVPYQDRQGWRAVSASDDGTIRVWDLSSFTGNAARLCNDAHYGGTSWSLAPGESTYLVQTALGANSVSSLLVPDGVVVDANVRANLSGRFRRDTPELSSWMNDAFDWVWCGYRGRCLAVGLIGSACKQMAVYQQQDTWRVVTTHTDAVLRVWELKSDSESLAAAFGYTDPNFQGRSVRLDPRNPVVDLAATDVPVDTISSIQVPPGGLVCLYSGSDFGGRPEYLIADSKQVSNDNSADLIWYGPRARCVLMLPQQDRFVLAQNQGGWQVVSVNTSSGDHALRVWDLRLSGSDQAVLYAAAQFGGNSVMLRPGDQIADLAQSALGSNMCSYMIPAGYAMIAYNEANLRNMRAVLQQSEPNQVSIQSVWYGFAGVTTATLPGHQGTPKAMALSGASGGMLVSFDDQGEIRTWLLAQPSGLAGMALDGSGQVYVVGKQDGRIGTVRGWFARQATTPVHAIAADATAPLADQRFLYWIEDPGVICRRPIDRDQPVKLADVSVDRSERGWELAIDRRQQLLYWSNGRAIWRGRIGNNQLSEPTIMVSHGESPHPHGLDIDDSSGQLYWVDKELGRVRRRADPQAAIEDLYTTSNPRRALALDIEARQIYWNADQRQQYEALVVDTPGLWYWLQDLGNPPHQRQQAAGLRDEHRIGTSWQPARALPTGVANPFQAAKREVLQFDGQQGHVSIGPVLLDCQHGFSVEVWVCYHSFAVWSRLIDLGNGPNASNIILANMAGTNDLILQVYNSARQYGFISARGALELNTWLYLVATIDSEGNASLYKNGTLLCTGHVGVPRRDLRIQNYIGRSNWPTDPRLDAQIGSLRMWNETLSEQAIQANAQAPFQSVANQLGQYDRSLLEQTSGPFLMRGHMDREHEAEVVFRLATDGGLVIRSQSIMAHRARIAAYRKQAVASLQAARIQARARREAQAALQAAHEQLHQQHEQAQQRVQSAQQAANQRRAQAHARLKAVGITAQQRVSAAKQSAAQHSDAAHQQADAMIDSANKQKRDMINDANHDLNNARNERAKYH